MLTPKRELARQTDRLHVDQSLVHRAFSLVCKAGPRRIRDDGLDKFYQREFLPFRERLQASLGDGSQLMGTSLKYDESTAVETVRLIGFPNIQCSDQATRAQPPFAGQSERNDASPAARYDAYTCGALSTCFGCTSRSLAQYLAGALFSHCSTCSIRLVPFEQSYAATVQEQLIPMVLLQPWRPNYCAPMQQTVVPRQRTRAKTCGRARAGCWRKTLLLHASMGLLTCTANICAPASIPSPTAALAPSPRPKRPRCRK